MVITLLLLLISISRDFLISVTPIPILPVEASDLNKVFPDESNVSKSLFCVTPKANPPELGLLKYSPDEP